MATATNPMSGPGIPLESERIFTPLGIRFWDITLDLPVDDGLACIIHEFPASRVSGASDRGICFSEHEVVVGEVSAGIVGTDSQLGGDFSDKGSLVVS